MLSHITSMVMCDAVFSTYPHTEKAASPSPANQMVVSTPFINTQKQQRSMKRTNKNRQAEYLQTGKSERTAVRAATCVTDYGHENTDVDFRKDKGRDKPLSTFLQASEIKTRQCM